MGCPPHNDYKCIYVYIMKQKGELVKISMNLPPDLWKQLKFKALEENTTATDILVRLAKKHLATSKGKKRRR